MLTSSSILYLLRLSISLFTLLVQSQFIATHMHVRAHTHTCSTLPIRLCVLPFREGVELVIITDQMCLFVNSKAFNTPEPVLTYFTFHRASLFLLLLLGDTCVFFLFYIYLQFF